MPIKLLPMFAAAFVTAFIAVAADAAEQLPYDAAHFVVAQGAGKPILIDISAPWCPTCKLQKPIIASLIQQRPTPT
jgi:thioredoxin 1